MINRNKKERTESLNGLGNRLELGSKSYQDKFSKMLNFWEHDLMNISFILEPEIKLQRRSLEEGFRVQTQNIMERNKQFFAAIELDQSRSFQTFEEKKDYFEKHWRKLKHDQAIQSFLADIKLDEYVWPEERVQLYQVRL